MPANKIDIFLCNTRQPISKKLLQEYLKILPNKEQIRLTKFSGPRWRNQLLSLALLYSELAAKTGESAENLKISRNINGKPYLEDFPQYEFNLSHCKDLIALAITEINPIGIDIERINQSKRNISEISERFFSPKENKALSNYKGHAQTLMFYRLWTLKEAWVKANGEALIPNIKKIEFLVDESKITIGIVRKFQDGQFLVYRPFDNFILTCCILNLSTELKTEDFLFRKGLPLQQWESIEQLGLDHSIQNSGL